MAKDPEDNGVDNAATNDRARVMLFGGYNHHLNASHRYVFSAGASALYENVMVVNRTLSKMDGVANKIDVSSELHDSLTVINDSLGYLKGVDKNDTSINTIEALKRLSEHEAKVVDFISKIESQLSNGAPDRMKTLYESAVFNLKENLRRLQNDIQKVTKDRRYEGMDRRQANQPSDPRLHKPT